ncbi:MAG: SLATT domain-containing protein [Candidatus Thiodiazotropha sp.]
MDPEKRKLLDCWRLRIRIAQTAHFRYADLLKRRHYHFGLPVVILSTVVGTSVFASLSDDPSTILKIVVGLVSLLAAILSSLQTFLDFSTQSEKHRVAAAKFSELKKKLEKELAFTDKNEALLNDFVNQILKDWNSINSDCPLPPGKLYNKVFNELDGKRCFPLDQIE